MIYFIPSNYYFIKLIILMNIHRFGIVINGSLLLLKQKNKNKSLLRYLKDFSISSGTKLNLFNKELNWFLKVHDCKRYANACIPCSIFFNIVAMFLYTRKKLANELQKRKHENVDCPHDCSSSKATPWTTFFFFLI